MSLIASARLALLWAPGIRMSPSPKGCSYSYRMGSPAFTWVLGFKHTSSCSCDKHFTDWAFFQVSHLFLSHPAVVASTGSWVAAAITNAQLILSFVPNVALHPSLLLSVWLPVLPSKSISLILARFHFNGPFFACLFLFFWAKVFL